MSEKRSEELGKVQARRAMALSFNQTFKSGERAILTSEIQGGPTLVTINGRGRKDGGAVFTFGNNWARPEDFLKVSPDLLGGLDDAYEGLREYYPEDLIEDNRAAIYLAVLHSGKWNDLDGHSQYEAIRDLIEAEAQRRQAARFAAAP